ncbi:MAG: 4a-hydroxytetrahydrobiopterin dehydratase [bacterium]
MKLLDQKCRSIPAGTLPISIEEAKALNSEIPGWVLAEKSISREFKLPDFNQAMQFVNKVAVLANQENHHPDIHISYNQIRLELATHKIGGLSLNDFILAAKIDGLIGA